MAHFYLHESLEASHVGAEVMLNGAEAKHAASVSRTRSGETIRVGNGRGLIISGTVVSAEPNLVVVVVNSMEEKARVNPRISLVQALAKGGRDELAIQMATELGVDAVYPWSASRSVVKWSGPKVLKSRGRWAAITREASKQSVRSWTPEVGPLLTITDLAELSKNVRMLVLEPAAPSRLSEIEPDDRDIVLVVGPEGGISAAESEQLASEEAQSVTLGETVLRTSSAGPAALAVLNTVYRRW